MFKRLINFWILIIWISSVVYAGLIKNPKTVLVGASRTDITPKFPVVLAGYGGRTKEFEGIDNALWARCLVIGRENPAVLVVIDNCGITKEVRAALAKRIKKLGIPEKNLVITYMIFIYTLKSLIMIKKIM